LNESLEESSKFDSLQKILLEIFISPVDAFDFYLNGNIISKWNIFYFQVGMWIYAPIMKLFLNGILFFSLEESSESPKQFILDGLLLSFFIYPTFFLIGLLLDSFRKYYKKNEFIQGEPTGGIGLLSFIPISTSFVFWILPKPLNALGITLSILFSSHLYYSALLNLDNYTKLDFKRLILYFVIVLGILSFILIIIGNMIRTKV
jgi:hypothetical protein